MRLAILVSVSHYLKEPSDLPACQGDVNLIGDLLNATNNYDEILKLEEKTGAQVKEEIAAFVEKHCENAFDEIFFYYTGHGTVQHDEFSMLFTDFEESKRNQTTLRNSDLDNWLRSFDAKLTVKVIDACFSGVVYVKDPESFEAQLKEATQTKFRNCYFMFFSTSEQRSFVETAGDFSSFTKSFGLAIQAHTDPTIRYKHIIDFISDHFEGNEDQNPIFVVQGQNTEIFCHIDEEVKKVVRKLEQQEQRQEPDHDREPSRQEATLKDMVERDAGRYFRKEHVEQILDELRAEIENTRYPREFSDLFELECLFQSSPYEVPDQERIGKWITRHGSGFFAEPTEEERPYRVERSFLPALLYVPKTKYRWEVSGFENTADCSYNTIWLKTNPRFANLPATACIICILFSKTNLRFFITTAEYRDKNWEERELPSKVDWQTVEFEIRERDKILEFINQKHQCFVNHVLQTTKDHFSIPAE